MAKRYRIAGKKPAHTFGLSRRRREGASVEVPAHPYPDAPAIPDVSAAIPVGGYSVYSLDSVPALPTNAAALFLQVATVGSSEALWSVVANVTSFAGGAGPSFTLPMPLAFRYRAVNSVGNETFGDFVYISEATSLVGNYRLTATGDRRLTSSGTFLLLS